MDALLYIYSGKIILYVKAAYIAYNRKLFASTIDVTRKGKKKVKL
jgi:hypothetical protein